MTAYELRDEIARHLPPPTRGWHQPAANIVLSSTWTKPGTNRETWCTSIIINTDGRTVNVTKRIWPILKTQHRRDEPARQWQYGPDQITEIIEKVKGLMEEDATKVFSVAHDYPEELT